MEIYIPDCYQKSIFDVNYELLKSKGVTCLLFDVDNTILPENECEVSLEAKQLIIKLKEDFKVILFSNGSKRRIGMIAKQLEVDYVFRALKPSTLKFLEVFKKYKLSEDEVAIIGDQLVTDIKGGNRSGIITILVDPVSKYDPIWTKISRLREKRIKRKLMKNTLFKERFYDEKM